MTESIAYRVLSMWQPWAMFTIPKVPMGLALKEWETRHWDFQQKGGLRRLVTPVPVVIHATKRFEKEYLHSVNDLYAKLGYPPIQIGKLIGVGYITTVMQTETVTRSLERHRQSRDESSVEVVKRFNDELRLGDWTDGRYAWRLQNVRALPNPIPFKGKQEPLYQLEPEIRAEVDAQVAAA